eukprot:230713-Chlamydomonas_euryale.AAC.2
MDASCHSHTSQSTGMCSVHTSHHVHTPYHVHTSRPCNPTPPGPGADTAADEDPAAVRCAIGGRALGSECISFTLLKPPTPPCRSWGGCC